MGYLSINNLYRDKRILDFKECFALLKVHGTSAHISYKDNKVQFFSGGEKYSNFITCQSFLSCEEITNLSTSGQEKTCEEYVIEKFTKKFIELGHENITVYGEAFGGKCQGMSSTYGPKLKFIAFDVMLNENWLNVETAEKIVNLLGLKFVPYVRIQATIESIEAEKLKPDLIAIEEGISSYQYGFLVNPREREGIVLRPITEHKDHRGNRVICKHKNDSFTEVKTKRELTTEDLKVLSDAEKIAEDWVTPMRLNHVLDKLPQDVNVEQTSDVIQAMLADIKKESEGEIVWSKTVTKYISTKTAVMFKNKLKQNLLES